MGQSRQAPEALEALEGIEMLYLLSGVIGACLMLGVLCYLALRPEQDRWERPE